MRYKTKSANSSRNRAQHHNGLDGERARTSHATEVLKKPGRTGSRDGEENLTFISAAENGRKLFWKNS